jgi:ubiquitin-conjugating enzyme E2 G1
MALKRLKNEYKELTKEPNYFFSVSPNINNFYLWDIIMIGPHDTIFENAIIKAQLEFPYEYPNKPPVFTFLTDLFHPNIYKNGKVCISILHEGVDEYNYESISERWTPSHSVSSILMSIISMLASPNFDSPANIDACKLWKENYNEYKKIIYSIVSRSQN